MSDSGAVLVVGGSGGIGRAVVEALLEAGLPVAFTWRSGRGIAHQLEQASGGRARAFHLDLADRERPAALVEEVEAAMGPIEGLVNGAGMQRGQLLAMTSDTVWDEILDINLGGTFRTCRAVLRGMVVRRHGAIVNIASLSASRGVAGLAAYAAAKAGTLALTRCLAREVGKRGVRVNAVVPGFVPTGMTEGLPESTVAALRDSECLPPGTTPPSVADAVVFLLSERAAAITGQELVVDSGAAA